ncbi:type II restriction endonuclease [Companilactobacillus mishanensis]|uniref:type II restriction endonuclease n=1 Tax=Companilactobacillus mishanensis TaxID=2486008 RepID=UPI0012951B24|nr:type II restriction endonuclease [Companilactobacillus mishanensis]MQS89573.1 restriction endonuclease [Companilactobacillus mishanensis]
MNLNEYLSKSNGDKFQYFMDTRVSTNRTPKYWVNWHNVRENIKPYELSLNTLNFLVGKDDIESVARKLFIEQPKLLSAIPILIASRDKEMDILNLDDDGNMDFYNVDFSKPDVTRIDSYMNFIKETGLLGFLQNDLNKSLVDYVYGVQTGLDSNGRKNRSGTQNETILLMNMKKVAKHNPGFEYKEQATAKSILSSWGIVVPEVLEKGAKGGRRYDGAIYNPEKNLVTVIETNFYGGGGSKLKSVSGEFSSIYETSLKSAPNVNFVWISDGPGWDTAKNPMKEAFDVIPTIINLGMVKQGFLSEISRKYIE